MQHMKSFIIIAITFYLSVLPKRAQQNSIQPAVLSISANQKGVFKCAFNNSNQPLPEIIVWLFNNSEVENFLITRQKALSVATSEDDIKTMTSTLTFVIDLQSASMFNNTTVKCLALVINEDSTQDLIMLTAKLYIHGPLPAPSDVRVNFAKNKMYTRWTHADRHNEIEPIAYHVSIMPMNNDSASINQCITYGVCVMEETLAGIGDSACINTSSNISVLGAFDVHVSNVSLLNHTNPSFDLTEVYNVSCSSEDVPVYTPGEFQDANVSVISSTTSLELKLSVPDAFTPSDAITLELNLLQPRVVDLLDVSIMEDGSTVQLQCVYAENSIVHGCLILIQCVDSSLTKSITLSEGQTYPLQGCELPCVKGTLYGYANNHGIVADEPSIIESIDFKQCISSPTPSPGLVPASAISPTAQGSLLIALFVLMSLMYCLPCSPIILA